MHSALPAPPPAAIDWTRTQLGDRAAWHAGLRLTVDIMLNTPLAMLLMWGREQIMVFNPAYAELCGTVSQRAPGGKVPSMPPAAWSWNPAAIAAAWDGASSQYLGQPLPLWREGGLRQQRLDLYYTPVRDDMGQVAGILCALAASAAAAATVATITNDAPAAPSVTPLDILVVEDNADALYLACETLRALGHHATAATSGEQALPALAARRYDLLFSDVGLPGNVRHRSGAAGAGPAAAIADPVRQRPRARADRPPALPRRRAAKTLRPRRLATHPRRDQRAPTGRQALIPQMGASTVCGVDGMQHYNTLDEQHALLHRSAPSWRLETMTFPMPLRPFPSARAGAGPSDSFTRSLPWPA